MIYEKDKNKWKVDSELENLKPFDDIKESIWQRLYIDNNEKSVLYPKLYLTEKALYIESRCYLLLSDYDNN